MRNSIHLYKHHQIAASLVLPLAREDKCISSTRERLKVQSLLVTEIKCCDNSSILSLGVLWTRCAAILMWRSGIYFTCSRKAA